MVSSRKDGNRKRHASGSGDEVDRRRRKRSESPRRRSAKDRPRERSPPSSSAGKEKDDEKEEFSESMSIEDTNKLRAKLGLAPLDLEEKPTERVDDDGLKVILEDGCYEFKHKPSENWGAKKKEQEIREKIEAAKKKRQLHEKVFKGGAKTLAEDDEEEDAASWVRKMREAEERKAAERERMMTEMEEEATKAGDKEKEKDKAKKHRIKKPKTFDTAGMVIGHSRDTFAEMQDQILVLEDKSVLDEGDETLVNPNMIENERHARNLELKLRKDPNRNFDEDVDQYGNKKDFGVLSKYDEDLEGVPKKTFRLDEAGGYDVDKEEREAKIRRDLEMANKKLVSLDMPDKFKLATEFYTQEEMVTFRKPKKVKKDKLRKSGKLLKADDLIPVETVGGANSGSRDRGRRHADGEDKELPKDVKKEAKEEVEEMETENPRWKKTMGGAVDVDRLKKFAAQDDESDEEFGAIDLSGVVVEDDANDELSAMLAKTRRLKHAEVKKETDTAQIVTKMLENYGGVKKEIDSEGEEVEDPVPEGFIRMDSTTEYCRNIGENLTYGLAGNRADGIDTSQLKQELEDESEALKKWKEAQEEKRERKRRKKQEKESKGGWREAGTSADLDSDDERELEKAKDAEYDSSDDDDGDAKKEYENVLGKEADVSKGVGAMLKLAAQKGYLDEGSRSKNGGQSLDHLRNRSKTQIESGKHDIEDKYMKKLDRLGTTGRGPVLPFTEKKDYAPDVRLEYVDNKGRPMEAKDAYRELSYKFHGRKPGKKQSEKRMLQREKKELLKQMNSSDTPLGTLSKQLKKQEQLQTPYLVLSGTGRSDHGSLKKE